MTINPEDLNALADLCHETRLDPLKFVRLAYPWGEEGPLEDKSIRTWQEDSLGEIGYELQHQAAEGRWNVIRSSRSSGHGPGKSAELNWIIQWALATYPDARVNVTANTETQLRTKTGAEMAKWHPLCAVAPMFKISPMSMYSANPKRRGTWRADLIPWSERNPEAVAGLHNAGKRLVLIFDEASAIPRIVFETMDGALTDANTEIMVLLRGNATRNTGYFYDANFGVRATRWNAEVIDCRYVEGINQELLKEWEEDEGVDSDYFRVRVRGLPPKHSDAEYISREALEAAMDRTATCFPDDPLIIGVDCARGGANETVIAYRQGYDAKSIPWDRLPFTPKPMEVASFIHDRAHSLGADMVFVDSGDVGLAVADRLNELGTRATDIGFGWRAIEDEKYSNRVAEMWARMRGWMVRGSIDTGRSRLQREKLVNQFCDRGFSHPDGRLRLESKERMTQRQVQSPDNPDALCLTFAEPVLRNEGTKARAGLQQAFAEY